MKTSRVGLRLRLGVWALAALAAPALLAARAHAQAAITPAARAELQAVAGRYPLLEVRVDHGKSAEIIFEDSSLTPDRHARGTWMFGPPVTAAEAAGCPPEKVLGRRIARAFWRSTGRATRIDTITVIVQSVYARAIGPSSLMRVGMIYTRAELEGPWAGDTLSLRSSRAADPRPSHAAHARIPAARFPP